MRYGIRVRVSDEEKFGRLHAIRCKRDGRSSISNKNPESLWLQWLGTAKNPFPLRQRTKRESAHGKTTRYTRGFGKHEGLPWLVWEKTKNGSVRKKRPAVNP